MISERIKEARINKGVSMRQAAADMGFPYTTYVNYEKGVSEPNSENLVKIAVYYNVTADFLVGVSAPEIKEETPEKTTFPALTRREQDLVSAYRLLDDRQKDVIDYQIRTFAEFNEYKLNEK